MTKVAIIGCGLIGQAWAVSFLRAGCAVTVWDADAKAPAQLREALPAMFQDLRAHGLLTDDDAALLARLRLCDTLAEAVAGVAYVQENIPERIEAKRAIFAQLDAAAPPDAILASSTSALRPSAMFDGLAGRARCLVAHPINPPYVVPAVEIVPAPFTGQDAVDRAVDLMTAIGQAPIVMKRELDGFVVNRLQGALLEEAFRLVADGYASAEDVDIAMREGLALRWSFMGPFETIDLNAPGGVRDYVERYGGLYDGLHEGALDRPDWSGPVLDQVLAERRAKLAEGDLAARRSWRDRRLMALARHKQQTTKETGA